MTQNLEKEKLKMLVCFNTQETTTDCNRLINKNLILHPLIRFDLLAFRLLFVRYYCCFNIPISVKHYSGHLDY